MRKKIASYLELIRVPNVFTAMADPMAGLIVASHTGVDIFKLPYLLASSALIYAGGCALNDYADRDEDSVKRPGRPIPAGRVNASGALSLGAVLIIAGIASATGAGLFPFLASCALSAATVAYNARFKNGQLAGAATMGLCRALNLILGMSAGTFIDPSILILPFITFAFVFTISLLGRREGDIRVPNFGMLSGWIAACVAVEYLLFTGYFMGDGVIFATIFHVVSGIAVLAAHSTRIGTGAAVQSLIISIPLLDASYSSGISGIMAGLPVAAMALPAIALSRRFRGT